PSTTQPRRDCRSSAARPRSTPDMTVALAVVAGVLIGLSLGALGGGGSILAVPVLVYLLGQDAAQATTGSLVVVGVTAVIGAVTGGAVLGAAMCTRVSGDVLLAAFAALMLVVGAMLVVKQVRGRRGRPTESDVPPTDDPIITFSPTFACHCPRALKVLVTATV